MKRIALNYIYLSRSHAGGKDQVGINLLKGFYKRGYTSNMYVICYDYSVDLISSLAPNIPIICLKSKKIYTESARWGALCYVNTIIVPKIIKRYDIDLILHLSCNTGLIKYKAISIVIPHDIKAVSHRLLADVKIPLYKYYFLKLIYYIDFMTNDGIIAISDTDKREIIDFYPKYANKVQRIYNPIDIKPPIKFCSKGKSDIVAINLQFHHKNIITLIKAFELIKDQIEDNLILIGNVPARVSYLKDYVYEHSLENRVKFAGFVDDEKKKRFLQSCKLYVNPTLFEGFGMTAVEAIIQGVPALISKIDANYEVTKGLCMYYEPAEDEKKLADAILIAINVENDVKREQNVVQASKILYEEYNYLNISDKYMEYFKNL